MIALFVAVVVASAGAPKPAAADPAALTAARALVQQLGIPTQLQKTMAQNLQMMRSGVMMRSMLAQQPGFVPAYNANKAKFNPVLQKAGGIQAEVAEKVMRDSAPAVIDAAVRVYASNYSAAELKGLSDFYRTPLGLALAERDGKVKAEISQSSGQVMGSKVEAAMQANSARITAALEPLKAIAAAPPPPAKK